MRKILYQKLTIGTLAASTLLSSIGTSMANIALPSISADFGRDFSEAKWVILAYLISSTLLSLVVGHLGDVKGRKTILLSGLALFSISTFLSGTAESLEALIFARVLQGIGASALMVLPISLIVHILPLEKSGRFIGFLATMSAVGTASGPSIGGFLISLFGWRSTFYLMGLMAIPIFLLSKKCIPQYLNATDHQHSHSQNKYSILSMLSNPPFIRPLGFNLTVSAVMMTTLVVGPFFLHQGLHLDPNQVGLIMSVGPVTSMISGIPSGYLVDRYSYQTVGGLGLVQLLIGTFFFAIATPHWGEWGFVLSAALLSIGYQLFQASNSTGLMKAADKDKRGLASGALNLSRNLGFIFGTYFMGGAFDLFSKMVSPAQATTTQFATGLQYTFLIAALLMLLLLIINFKNKKRSPYET